MDQLPIRIKLDFSGLDNPDYKYVWHPVMRRNLDRIADLKRNICDEYDLDHDSVDLFLAGALLREEDTILLLREDDNIQVMCKQKPPKDVKKSRKRKHEREIAGEMNEDSLGYDEPNILTVRAEVSEAKPAKTVKKRNGYAEGSCPINTVAQVTNGDDELDTSETLDCPYRKDNSNDLEIPKKQKKKKKKRHLERDLSPVANCVEMRNVHNMVSKELDSVTNKISFKDAELESSKKETPTSEYHIKTNDSSSVNRDSNSSKYAENSSVVVSPEQFQNSVNVESSNCPKKKRKRKRKRKTVVSEIKSESNTNKTVRSTFQVSVPSPKVVDPKRKSDVSGRKSENNINKTVRSAFQVSVSSPKVDEPKNKHIRFEILTPRDRNDGEHFSASIDECKNSFPDPASELSDKFLCEDLSSRPNFSSPVKMDVVCHQEKNNTQHAITPSEKLSVAGIEKTASCEQYAQDFEICNFGTCNSYKSSVEVSASPGIISLPLVDNEIIAIDEKDRNDKQFLEIPVPSTNGERPVLPEAPVVQMENQTVDYDSYPQLHTVPQVGALIAFKLLELSDLYCPEVSDYKEGVLVEFDKTADTITVELQKEEVKKKKTGKFENVYESDEENEPEPDIVKRITCKWMDLISPRLLVSSSLSTISNPLYLSFSEP